MAQRAPIPDEMNDPLRKQLVGDDESVVTIAIRVLAFELNKPATDAFDYINFIPQRIYGMTGRKKVK